MAEKDKKAGGGMAGGDPIQPWEDDPLLQYFEDPNIPSRVHVDARTKKSKAVNNELENMQGGTVGIYGAYRTGTKTQQKRAAKRIKKAIKMTETPKKIKKAGGAKQGKAIGGPIENPMEKKQKPLYEEELGMYGGGSVRKKVYARGGSTRPTRG